MAETVGEAESRRTRSIAKLIQHDVPYILHLPMIETEDETLRRKTDEVGLRIICLALVSMKGAGADHGFVLEGVQHYGVHDDLSPDEADLVYNPQPSDHQMLQLSWRVEAAHALLWSVESVETLSYPSSTTDWNAFWETFHEGNRVDFLQGWELRPQDILLDEADLIYRLHWAAREAGLNGREGPAGLYTCVVMERHYALNWLVAPLDDPYPWDSVPTHT